MELVPAATGEGWVYTPAQRTTAWRPLGTYSSSLPEREKALLREVRLALEDEADYFNGYSSWEEPSFVVVAGTVYLATANKSSRTVCPSAEEMRRYGYYRPFWRRCGAAECRQVVEDRIRDFYADEEGGEE